MASKRDEKAGVKRPFYAYVKHPSIDGEYPVIGHITQELFNSAVNYKPDPSDLFIASYPKNGTTWLMNIIHLIKTNGVPLGKGQCLDDVIPFLEFEGGEVIKRAQKPRTIKTHLFYDMTPHNPDAKYVFVARNPKDVVVSFYYHTVGFDEHYKFKNGTFDDYFGVFLSGGCDSGDYFKMVPEWFKKSQERKNIHFMLYEDMKKDVRSEILKLAEFLDDSYQQSLLENDEELLNKVIEFSSFKKMQKDSKDGVFCPEIRPADLPFVRKGITGDWKTHLSRDQSERIDQRLAEAGRLYPGFDQLWSEYDGLLSF
ncbi:unnamed protein product [Clavelina lepadiformis]|uniref:Sulfotransferase n=1 Tax=Clavelina lepadiformis TaxID=159417 RepID=A0ABP0GHE3_CLALP